MGHHLHTAAHDPPRTYKREVVSGLDLGRSTVAETHFTQWLHRGITKRYRVLRSVVWSHLTLDVFSPGCCLTLGLENVGGVVHGRPGSGELGGAWVGAGGGLPVVILPQGRQWLQGPGPPEAVASACAAP